MGVRENVSRRRVLKLSGALSGGIFMMTSRHPLSIGSNPTIEGWITKGEQTAIADERATIEEKQSPGMSLCNDGDTFKCRTCRGVEFYLLVPSDSPEPTVEETYRFNLTSKENLCGNFQVQLDQASPCGNSTTTDTTTTETTTDTTTTTTTTEVTSTTEPDD